MAQPAWLVPPLGRKVCQQTKNRPDNGGGIESLDSATPTPTRQLPQWKSAEPSKGRTGEPGPRFPMSQLVGVDGWELSCTHP